MSSLTSRIDSVLQILNKSIDSEARNAYSELLSIRNDIEDLEAYRNTIRMSKNLYEAIKKGDMHHVKF